MLNFCDFIEVLNLPQITMILIVYTEKIIAKFYFNRAYPENANPNTCAPNTLKFHTFCGLCVTKQCFKFKLDILNSSGVIAT